MDPERLRLLFMGTSGFALPVLESLQASVHTVAAVVSRPPRRAGRGRRVTQPPVAERAEELMLPLLQPEELDDDFLGELRERTPDIIVTVDYGAWIPRPVLDATPLGVLNVHPSLLPRHRGAAPIERAILEGDETTGVAFMLTDEGWDTGPVLALYEEPIRESDNRRTLADRLAIIASERILDVLPAYARGELEPMPQKGRESYAGKIRKSETVLDWSEPAGKLERQVRALSPSPGARTTYGGKLLKILRAEVSETALGPGTVRAEDGVLETGTATKALRILELQPAGKRVMTAEEYLRGSPMATGETLGR